MKKTIKTKIIIIVLIATILSTIKIFPLIQGGYNLYKTATSEISLEDKVAELKGKDNYINLDAITDEFIDTLLKSEDKRFYYHLGFDPIATSRAIYNDIRLGYFAQGGSTITQQLAKNIYFSFEKKIERKVAELFAAFDIERNMTKNEILEIYINIAYYGEGCFGLKEAANHYYFVDPIELSSEQIVALVWTIKSPNNYNPNEWKLLTCK